MAGHETMGYHSADWSSIREPIRPNKFYKLRCLDFARKQQLPGNGKFGCGASSSSGNRGGPNAKLVQESVSETDEDLVVKVLQTRKKLRSDVQKVELQLHVSREKVEKEVSLQQEAKTQLEELNRQRKTLAAELEVEMVEVKRQQTILRNLRAQVRHHRRIAEGRLPPETLPSFQAGGTVTPRSRPPFLYTSQVNEPDSSSASSTRRNAGQPGSCRSQGGTSRRPFTSPGAKPVVSPSARPFTSPSSSLFAREVPESDLGRAFGVPQVSPGEEEFPPAPQGEAGQVEDVAPGASQEPKVEVQAMLELLEATDGPSSLTLARLLHPNGSVAILDASNGRPCHWRLQNGGWCAGVNLRLLRPVGTADEGIGALMLQAAWRFVSLDYSNNELSAEFMLDAAEVAIGKDEHGIDVRVPFRFHRKVSLGAVDMCEEFVLERASLGNATGGASDVSLQVVEEEAVAVQLCKAAAGACQTSTNGDERAAEFVPQAPSLGLPVNVWLPAGTGRWSAKRRFTVPGAAPLTDGVRAPE